MTAERAQMVPKSWRPWASVLVALAASITALVLLFPHLASAFLLEKAGRVLDSGEATGTALLEAERTLQQALHWRPENAQAYWLLARYYERQADGLAALEALTRYLKFKPNDPWGHWKVAEACASMSLAEGAAIAGAPCGADASSRQAILVHHWRESGQTAASFVRAGNSFGNREDWTLAREYYERALLLDPRSASAWQGLAKVYEAQAEPQQAFEAYGHVVALGSDPAEVAAAYKGRGEIMASAQRWAEASAELAQAVALRPDQGQYHLDYGWSLYQEGTDLALARAELTRAADLMPKNPWPYLRLAILDFALADYAGTVDNAGRAIQVQPDLFWSWLWQGLGLQRLDRLTEAEESLRRATDLAPDRAVTHAELGRVLLDLGRVEQAAKELEQAVALSPQDVSYSLGLADTYRADGRIDQALEMYRRVLELDAGNSQARQALEELRP